MLGAGLTAANVSVEDLKIGQETGFVWAVGLDQTLPERFTWHRSKLLNGSVLQRN